jgi:hypothetical protein
LTKSPTGVVQTALSGNTAGGAGGRTPPQPLKGNDKQRRVAAAPEDLKAGHYTIWPLRTGLTAGGRED